MKVTKVQIFKSSFENSKVKGFVNIGLNEILTIYDVKIVESKSGELFLSFPSKKVTTKDGTEKYVDYVYPSKELRESMTNAVLKKLNDDGGKDPF